MLEFRFPWATRNVNIQEQLHFRTKPQWKIVNREWSKVSKSGLTCTSQNRLRLLGSCPFNSNNSARAGFNNTENGITRDHCAVALH